MSTSIHGELTGSFTSSGAQFNLSLPCGYDEFELVNITDIGSAAAATPVMKARGTSLMPAGSAFVSTKTNGAATLDLENTILTNGFSFLKDTGSQVPGALVSNITAITAANPAVVSTITPAPIGSVVRLINTTGMEQIASLDFTVTAVAAGVSMSLGYMDASTFAAPATGGSFRILPFDMRYYPRRRTITKITQAAQAVVTMSVTHGYTVGEHIRFKIPAEFGMTQLDGQDANITAIDTVNNTITINIDTTGYTAFAFPTSAIAAAGVSFAQVIPIGETAKVPYQNLLDDSKQNLSISGITIGTSVQTTGKLYQWFCRKCQQA